MTRIIPLESAFSRALLRWHADSNHRYLPWKGIKDPYKIWVSEILLQQTRAAQASPYYLSFMAAFPRIEDLAQAPEDRVYRLWQGLGYYRRCQNMLRTARFIVHELQSQFPRSYEGLLALPGIGPYTAAAIASFAFGLPHAVVDGNVIRILSRHFGIQEYADRHPGKALFANLAQDLLDPIRPGDYNQAIMDLGAQICKPQNPSCSQCPLEENCLARNEGQTAKWPLIRPKPPRTNRYFHYLILENNQQIWIQKRREQDIWKHLYEPYLIEAKEPLTLEKILAQSGISTQKGTEGLHPIASFQQTLTHQKIWISIYRLEWKGPLNPPGLGRWWSASQLGALGFPRRIVPFMTKEE